MGRLSRPPTPRAEALRRSLRAYINTRRTSVSALAKSYSVTQSTLYRFWNGQTKEPSTKLLPVLNYAHNSLTLDEIKRGDDKPPLSPILQVALKACGNQMEEALVLEQLVMALAPIVRNMKRKKS